MRGRIRITRPSLYVVTIEPTKEPSPLDGPPESSSVNNALVRNILNGSIDLADDSFRVALFTSEGEVDAESYDRAPINVRLGSAHNGSVVDCSESVEFVSGRESWGVITHYAIVAEDDRLLYMAAADPQSEVAQGDTLTINFSGSLISLT